MTECNRQIDLFSIGRRTVSISFSGALTTSDAGVLALRKIDQRLGLTEQLTDAVRDHRNADRIDHSVQDLLRQRIYQIALGYEDADDADTLRHDAALQAALGRVPSPENALGSQPTLSRFEQRSARENVALSEVLLDIWIDRLRKRRAKSVVLDIDSTDFATYGAQQLSMFHGHYGHYMYHPILVFDGEGWPVAAVLRPGKTRTYGAVAILRRIITRLRAALPKCKVLVRADAGFSTPELYALCEGWNVDYLIGLITHSSLVTQIEPDLKKARRTAKREGSARIITSFHHRWGKREEIRRIIAKVEVTSLGDNPRFMITNLTCSAERAYDTYTARGSAENRIKDLKNALDAGRMSCSSFDANQFRLLLHTSAYALMFAFRETLATTALARAQFDTLRLKLLKLGARVIVSARRIWFEISSSAPNRPAFEAAARILATPTG